MPEYIPLNLHFYGTLIKDYLEKNALNKHISVEIIWNRVHNIPEGNFALKKLLYS